MEESTTWQENFFHNIIQSGGRVVYSDININAFTDRCLFVCLLLIM
jgi:hypothetical protein